MGDFLFSFPFEISLGMFLRLSQRSLRPFRSGSAYRSTSTMNITPPVVPKHNFSSLQSNLRISCYNINSSSSSFNPIYTRRFYGTKITQFNLADVGEGIAECEIVRWGVEEGQEIQQFDLICEVLSDKSSADITSPYDGKVTKLHYKKGDMAKVGSPLIDIIVDGDSVEDDIPEPAKEEPKQESSTSSSSNNTSTEKSEESFSNHQTLQTKSGPVKILATPAVRRIANENNVDLRDVRGTGKDGRILKEDIIQFIEGGQQSSSAASSTTSTVDSGASPSVSSSPSYQLEDREVPVTGIMRAMVKSMTAACSVPHFGYCDEYDVSALKTLRAQMKPLAEERKIKLSYLPFLIKACSLALKEYPSLNAFTNSDCSSVTIKGSHNIGLAMDTPNGLIVPNIKNVQDLSIFEIAKELNELQALGAAGKLEKKHLEGGTFTLSNVGAIGGTYASPVLFLPQVAIGALGKIQTLPRFDADGKVYPAHLMNISWSADHRVVDGASMARFSNAMKSYIEQPNNMMLAMK